MVLLVVSMPIAGVQVSEADAPTQLLRRAESVMTSKPAEFDALLKQIESESKQLSPNQRSYLTYLEGFQAAYRGDSKTAISLLDEVAERADDVELRFRAGATEVNILGIGRHYAEAFNRLSQLLDQLPQVTDNGTRVKILGVAAQLYGEAGQYDLAIRYVDDLLADTPRGRSACTASYFKVSAQYHKGILSGSDKSISEGIDTCVAANEMGYANAIRYFVARLDEEAGKPKLAIKLLLDNYPIIEALRYPPLLAAFDSELAQGYWDSGDPTRASQFALKAISKVGVKDYPESLVIACKLLYLIAQKQGDIATALAYHEKYMAADKGYLNDVSAKALAYQTVKQQVLAKKLQIDTLNKQNQILTLQQTLAKKAAETSRLYIILLLIVLASIALWTYRVKRSQLRFMKLARRDGLTGIFNRQHFVNEAELQLRYCRKSERQACLVLIDLDHFKVVNDTHGHAVGDRVLKRAVEACQQHLRSTDIFGRLGGEEFGIVLPECTLEQALNRAEQIRVAIATATSGDDDDAPGIPISASFGVATIARSGYELRQLLIHADDGLYLSKREGRNRVSVCYDTQPRQRVAGVATDRV
jgi:diguanylate cyclase (GGDEF) domain